MTVVDFPCAIAECVTSNWITVLEIMKFSHVTLRQRFALALQARARARYVRMRYTRVDLLRHTFLVTICVTSRLNEIPRAHGKSTTVTRRPPPPLNVWPARLRIYTV